MWTTKREKKKGKGNGHLCVSFKSASPTASLLIPASLVLDVWLVLFQTTACVLQISTASSPCQYNPSQSINCTLYFEDTAKDFVKSRSHGGSLPQWLPSVLFLMLSGLHTVSKQLSTPSRADIKGFLYSDLKHHQQFLQQHTCTLPRNVKLLLRALLILLIKKSEDKQVWGLR